MSATDTTHVEPTMKESGDDILSTLVGEGKKFRTVDDLAKSKVEADSFINKLKDENNALRSLISNQDDTKRSTQIMEDLLARVSQATQTREKPEGTTPSGDQPRNQSESLTARDAENLYRVLRQREKEEENLNRALSKVKEKYLDKTDEYLDTKSKELGLDRKLLEDTARRSPQAFLNLLGDASVTSNAGAKGGPRSSVNSAAVVESGANGSVRNAKYYDKLKSEMGAKAFVLDKKIQIQMHRDMSELGDAWDSE